MKKYAIGGAIIGVLQFIDAAALYLHKGAATGFSLAFAAAEFIWAIISLIFIIRVKHKLTRLLAIAFFSYSLLGWVLSVIIPNHTAQAIIPMEAVWYVILGGIFGLAYCLSSIYVASKQ